MLIKKNYLLIAVLAISFSPALWADDDGDESGEGRGFSDRIFSFFTSKSGVENLSSNLYKDSCGECHFAYQPGLLTQASWQRLLAAKQLEDHFGENAELDEADRKQLLVFLGKHAADQSNYRISIKIAGPSSSGQPPLRITETRYIRRKHHELTDREVKNNKDVRFLGNCTACHREAKNGTYEEDTVSIPNFPNWES